MEKGICFPIFLLVSGCLIFPVSWALTCRSVLNKRRDVAVFVVNIYGPRGNPPLCDLSVEQNGLTKIGPTCYVGNRTCRNNDEDLFKAEIRGDYARFYLLKGANKTKSRIRCYWRNSPGWYLECPQTIQVLPGDVPLELISPANGTVLKQPLYTNPTFVFKVSGFPILSRTDLYYRNSGQYQILDKDDYDLKRVSISKQRYELYNLTLVFPGMIRDDTYFRLDIGDLNNTIKVYFRALGDVKPVPLQLVSPPNNTDLPVPYKRPLNPSFVVAGLSFKYTIRLYRQERRYNARCTALPRSSYNVTIFYDNDTPRKHSIALKIRGISRSEEERYCLDIQVNAEKIRIMFTTSSPLKLISPANRTVLIPPVCRNPSFVFTIAGFPSLYRTNLYYRNSGQYEQLDRDDYGLKRISIGKRRYELYNLTLAFPSMVRDDTFFRLDIVDWNNTIKVYFRVQGSAKTGTARRHVPLQLVSPPNNTDFTVPRHRRPLNASFVVAGLSFPSSIRLYRQGGKNNVRCTPLRLPSSRHVTIANDCDNPSKQQANITIKWDISFRDRADEKGYCLDIQGNAEKIRILFTTSRSPGYSHGSNWGLIVVIVLGSGFFVFVFIFLCCIYGLKKWRRRIANRINQRTSSLPLGGSQRRPSVPLRGIQRQPSVPLGGSQRRPSVPFGGIQRRSSVPLWGNQRRPSVPFALSTSRPFTVTNSSSISYTTSRLSHTEATRPGDLHRTTPTSLAAEPPSYESVMGIPSEPPPPYPGNQKTS